MSTAVLEPSPAKAPPKPVCRHCGAALLDERMRASGFCCAGCSYVYRLVHEHGLAGYYRIKDDITAPTDPAVFQPRDYAWLETAQRVAEAATTATPELTLDIQGISCAGCVWLIERIFQQQPGAGEIIVNAQYGSMRLRWVQGKFSAADFARKLQAFGYLAGPAGETPAEPESRGLVRRIGLCTAFAMNVMLFSLPVYFGMEPTYEWAGLFGLLSLAFGTLSFLVGGTYFLGRAVRALGERAMHIDLPIALGIVGAYAGSLYGWLAGEERFVYFDFVATFILLMLVGRWAQVAAIERNRRRLLRHHPKPPRVQLANGTALPPEQLRAGQTVVLAAGQTLPVESRLESVSATFSLASINGEAEPRVFRAGQRVPSGAVNVGRSELRLVTLQGWDESLLAQLLKPAQRTGARHGMIERIVQGYLIGILLAAVLSGIGWWLATEDPLRTWAVVTAVLVVSCPCAIALAFPLVDEVATVALRRRGVFVREGDLWARLSRVRKIVFDKTGTLTLETPVLQNPEVLEALDSTARSALLEIVRDSAHPISQSLLENLLASGPGNATAAFRSSLAGSTRGSFSEGQTAAPVAHVPTLTKDRGDSGPVATLVSPATELVRETTGFGVEYGAWSLGRAGWRDTTAGGDTVFARDGEVLAQFRFLDAARPDARSELSALGREGFSTYILSGDHGGKVALLAAELGLPPTNAWGGLTPEAKARWLDEHGANDVLMLGDGANDSLAFDRALCRGTPVIHRGVLEQKADFYYLNRGIGGLRALFAVNALRRRTHLTVLVFSIAYNLLAVGLAVAGHMNPLVAAVLMPINSLLTLALVTGGMRHAFRLPQLRAAAAR